MITTRHLVVLVSVLCTSITATLAQDNIPRALVTNKEEEALARHRLTVENVRQLFAVERELLELMKRAPHLEMRAAELERSIDPQRLGHSLVVGAKVYEGVPEIAQILQRQKISGREYLLTKITAMSAEMMDQTLKNEALQHELGSEISKFFLSTSALQFWRAMDPTLKAEAAEWKKVREEMARH